MCYMASRGLKKTNDLSPCHQPLEGHHLYAIISNSRVTAVYRHICKNNELLHLSIFKNALNKVSHRTSITC